MQVERRPLQRRQCFTAEKSPAEDVVLALPGRQRLVGRQVELPLHVLGPRRQQPLAHQAGLRRADRAQTHLSATRALDASCGFGIVCGNHLEPGVAIACDRACCLRGLGDLLFDPGSIAGRFTVFAVRLLATLESHRAVKGRQAGQVQVGVAGPLLVVLDAFEQDIKRGRDAVGFEEVGFALQAHRAFGLADRAFALRALCRVLVSGQTSGHQHGVGSLWAGQKDFVRAFPVVG